MAAKESAMKKHIQNFLLRPFSLKLMIFSSSAAVIAAA
jgi:hypothetical protein